MDVSICMGRLHPLCLSFRLSPEVAAGGHHFYFIRRLLRVAPRIEESGLPSTLLYELLHKLPRQVLIGELSPVYLPRSPGFWSFAISTGCLCMCGGGCHCSWPCPSLLSCSCKGCQSLAASSPPWDCFDVGTTLHTMISCSAAEHTELELIMLVSGITGNTPKNG